MTNCGTLQLLLCAHTPFYVLQNFYDRSVALYRVTTAKNRSFKHHFIDGGHYYGGHQFAPCLNCCRALGRYHAGQLGVVIGGLWRLNDAARFVFWGLCAFCSAFITLLVARTYYFGQYGAVGLGFGVAQCFWRYCFVRGHLGGGLKY